ncbi:MAG: indolepyruvate oxidoreductase subunit beta [Desulfobacterales bacterium]|nr:indolepyruvate oxidoreductase subunit beta [Desulfobacterales bacterium]
MKVIRLVVVAVGGQGNLLASRILGEASMRSNISVHMNEIHGMAQRGGVVESSLVFGDASSSIISDGEADILLSFEPSEALRALKKCSKNSIVITNRFPLPPFTVMIGKGKYPDMNIVTECIQSKVRQFISLDAVDIAMQAGNPLSVNMVLLGALMATNILPLSIDHVLESITLRTKKEFVQANIQAFNLGYSQTKQSVIQ